MSLRDRQHDDNVACWCFGLYPSTLASAGWKGQAIYYIACPFQPALASVEGYRPKHKHASITKPWPPVPSVTERIHAQGGGFGQLGLHVRGAKNLWGKCFTTLQSGHLLCHSKANNDQAGVGLMEMERLYSEGKQHHPQSSRTCSVRNKAQQTKYSGSIICINNIIRRRNHK